MVLELRRATYLTSHLPPTPFDILQCHPPPPPRPTSRNPQVEFPFKVQDPDGNDPFVIVSDTPKSSHAVILSSHDGTETPITYRVSSQVQWASGWANFSSQFARKPTDDYGISQIVGAPESSVFGDSRDAWCPLTIDGGCDNDAQSDDHFYTEFFEAVFDTPMYLSRLVVHENYGPGWITGVQVRSPNEVCQRLQPRNKALPPPSLRPPQSPRLMAHSTHVCTFTCIHSLAPLNCTARQRG